MMIRRFIGMWIAKFRKERLLRAAIEFGCDPEGAIIFRDDMEFYVSIRDNEVRYIK